MTQLLLFSFGVSSAFKPAGSAFGATSVTSSGGLFGTTTSQPASSGLFGANTMGSTMGSSLTFGATASPFGATSTPFGQQQQLVLTTLSLSFRQYKNVD